MEILAVRLNSMEEYQSDLNKFAIELSQINQKKLKKSSLEEYMIIDQFLSKTNLDIENFNYHSGI